MENCAKDDIWKTVVANAPAGLLESSAAHNRSNDEPHATAPSTEDTLNKAQKFHLSGTLLGFTKSYLRHKENYIVSMKTRVFVMCTRAYFLQRILGEHKRKKSKKGIVFCHSMSLASHILHGSTYPMEMSVPSLSSVISISIRTGSWKKSGHAVAAMMQSLVFG
jgi:hypothetical protein